jgi:hypothetical protein
VRFVDLLRATVLLSAGGATTLAALTVVGATGESDDRLVLLCAAWWLVAMIIGSLLGRGDRPNEPIARALADARAATSMPELRPTRTLLNRLWPLLLVVVLAGGLAFLAPSIPGVAVGFTLIWSLAWRRQHAAVQAVEERDGVTFYVDRTSPIGPIRLLRLPGFRRERTHLA